jgi:hypothetical protein
MKEVLELCGPDHDIVPLTRCEFTHYLNDMDNALMKAGVDFVPYLDADRFICVCSHIPWW